LNQGDKVIAAAEEHDRKCKEDGEKESEIHNKVKYLI
jgi:hypothetical protein